LLGLPFRSKSLVTALIYFELGEIQNSLEHAKKLKSNLEEIVKGYPKVRPMDLADLTICYAFDNDREKVESTIPRIRALTEDVNWKYRAQVHCEMVTTQVV
jgi:hypothetical protein